MAKNEPVPVGGVWLSSLDGRLRVLVDVGGVWRVAIDEAGAFNADGTPYTVSHCANACGAYRWPVEPVLAAATSSAGCIGAGCDCECHRGPSYPVFRVDPCPRCNLIPAPPGTVPRSATPDAASDGVDMIGDERDRQLYRWSAANDDRQTAGELARCARHIIADVVDDYPTAPTDPWPFQRAEYVQAKYGHDHIRRLTIAGALIAAEIDRLLRRGR